MRSEAAPTFEVFDKIVGALTVSALCRGVSDTAYPLTPSLFRINSGEFDLLERNLMWLFTTQGRPYIPQEPSNPLEWLIVAQHHGLPTRLLDWTLSPLIAAFFAVQSLSTTDAAVYILDRGLFQHPEDVDLKKLDDYPAIFPPHITNRITAQHGMFTIHPTARPQLDGPDILKVVIPATAKRHFLGKLTKYGVHDAALFPGLDGLSKHLRRLNHFP